jgi:hypothetical protein
MNVKYVTGGPGGINGVRQISFDAGSDQFVAADEALGRRTFRGQTYVRGIVTVEDALTATALVVAAAADATFTVNTSTGNGTGTIMIKGFQCLSYRATILDGIQSQPVPGYAVVFEGIMVPADSPETAAMHVQNP